MTTMHVEVDERTGLWLEPQPVETPKHLRKLRIGGCVLETELILKI